LLDWRLWPLERQAYQLKQPAPKEGEEQLELIHQDVEHALGLVQCGLVRVGARAEPAATT